MNKQEIIFRLSKRAMPGRKGQKLMRAVLDHFTDLVILGLERDGEVKIAGLGTIKLVNPNRRARLPGSDRYIRIGPRITFIPSKDLRQLFHKNYDDNDGPTATTD